VSIIIKSGASGSLANVTTDGELSTAADTQAFNGTTWEKAKTANAANATTGTGIPASGAMGFDGTAWHRLKAGSSGDLAVSITNPNAAASGAFAGITAAGALNVALEALPLLSDAFDGGTLDTAARWTLSGSVNPTNTGSQLLIAPDVTANATSVITTQPTFPLSIPLAFVFGVIIEPAVTLGNHRFFGFGLPPSSPGTAAAPLQNAVGFEVDTAGVLRASVYSNGARVFTQPLTRPTDGLEHFYSVQASDDAAFFYLDSLDVAVAVAFVTPMVKVLPLRLASLNSASVTVGTPTIAVNAVNVLDPSRAGTGISDGVNPWRKAKVDATGALSTAPRAADLVVSVTAAASAAVTATLPAAGPGLYHYITNIDITRYATATITGTATPNVVATTNMPGSLAWTCASAAAVGTITDRIVENYTGAPVRCSTANTNTTVVTPATSNVIWRVTVHYYTAP
jgi:hypothetical protein